MSERMIQQVENEDKRNAAVSAGASAAHLRELTQVVMDIVKGTVHSFALSDFAMRAIQKGLPVRREALFLPEHVLQMEAHKMCLCFPGVPQWLKTQARAWLAHKLKKREQDVEGDIVANFALGGTIINKSGE